MSKRRFQVFIILNIVMPRTGVASPAFIKTWRSRIKYGMTPFFDNLNFLNI